MAAAAARDSMFSLVIRTLLLVTMASAQGSVQLSCGPDWTLYGDRCYRLYTKLLSWQGALDVCQTNGAYLSQIGDFYTNDHLGTLASSSSVTDFWIGLNRLSVPASNTTYSKWSDDTPSSVYQAFWDDFQPDLNEGDCVYVSQSRGQPRWSFSTCEWKRAFVCELSACPSGSYQCSTGECVQSSRTCDGTNDCSDGSDEINCPSHCKDYIESSEGSILSPNFPGGYPVLSECQWTIEGPLGSNIFLQVNSIDVQAGKDELVIMGGGKTALSSYNLARMSGVNAPAAAIRSLNNFMIVRFYSDGSVQGTGFNLTWTAVQTGIPDAGQTVSTSNLGSLLSSPRYSNPPYLTNQETLWIISSPDLRTIITLQLLKVDLAPGDYIHVRDGSDASAPLLAQYTGSTGPLFALSTGPKLYILMKTGKTIDNTHQGFLFRYFTGCQLFLTQSTGEIFSPGYGVVNYANYVTCTYSIRPPSAKRTTLRFDPQYDVEYQNDKLQVYVGRDSSGIAMHSLASEGYTETPAPVQSNSGNLFVSFKTNAIVSRMGWRAIFSNSCPVPSFTAETILTPPQVLYDYGDKFNVSCPEGYVFDSLEFYTQQNNGLMVSMDIVQMECLFGGEWNVRRYPQCVPRYCAQAPEILHGYVQSATGAVFNSTATYVCAQGYAVTGSPTITCQSDGTWQTPPICLGESCSSLSTSIAAGTVQLEQGDGREAGSVYTYSCDSGYVLSGSPILYCNSSGDWTHPVPTCEKKQCKVPTLQDGIVLSGGNFVDFSTTLAVFCINQGFELVGNSAITCLANQSFSALPECRDKNECTTSPCQANSECINTLGSYSCSCLSGYADNTTACVNIDECSNNKGGCSDICVDTDGSYECQCPVGYTLYTQDGTMGYNIPASETGLRAGDTYYINHTCVRNQCAMPTAITNGYLTEKQVQYNYGDKVAFSCLPGFVLNGQATLQCQANSTWSAELPTCQVPKCPADQIPSNLVTSPVAVVPAGEVDFRTSIDIMCDVPGIGQFNKTRTCRFEPGQQVYRLQGDTYECGVVDCGFPLVPPGGRAVPMPATTTFGSTFQFMCSFLYDVVGSNNLGTNIIGCAADSYWTFFNITCIKRQCPFPGVPPGGAVTFQGNGYDYFDQVTFSCLRSGFQPTVASQRCGISETGTSLSWGGTTPSCVDVEPPTFINCPSSPVYVNRYSPAGFPAPTASDNSGSVASVTVSPAYFYPSQPIAEDITVNYTATDHANLTVDCIIQIIVNDTTPPTIQCPTEQVLNLSSSDASFSIFDLSSAGVVYNSSDAVLTFSSSVPLNFSYADIGTAAIVTAAATDTAGNSASCQFQVVVQAIVCEPATLSSVNTQKLCASTTNGGYSCNFRCNSGYFFYDGTDSFTTTCEPGQSWNQPYVPSCVESAQVQNNMGISLSYATIPAQNLSESCQQNYNAAMLSALRNSYDQFKQICIGQSAITNITYNEGSLLSTYDNNTLQLSQQFSMLFESLQDPQLEYATCYSRIRFEMQSISSTTGNPESLRTLTAGGCPSISASAAGQTELVRTCTSNYKRRVINGVTVCLPCAPGTSKSSSGVCEPCGMGQYWVTGAAPSYGSCVDCPRGQTTLGEGSIGAESCIVQCDDNFVSSTGMPPCRECTGNSFAVNSTYCHQCSNNTLALRKENPLSANCNAKVCTYNLLRQVQMLGSAVQVQKLTVEQCQDLCEQWDNLPTTSSVCVGFNYEKNLKFCFLYDRESRLETKMNYDYYERRCAERNLSDCFCAPPCSPGYYSTTGYQPDCQPCPVGFYSSTSAASYCQECPTGQTTQTQAATTCVTDAASFVCQNNPCQNNGACSVLLHDAYCTCEPGFTGRYCETPIDFCASSPCYNNGTCTSTSQGFSCSCLSGFQGDQCQTNIDDCTPTSCSRHGTCIDGVNSFTCDCVENYEGSQCQQQIQNGCDLFPCSGNSTCRPTSDYHRVCDCFPGFTGPLCDTEIDECESQPCMNGGTCLNRIDGFDCVCRASFTGATCQDPVKSCITTSCGVADQCINDPVTGLPLCICSTGYIQGEICQYSFSADTAVGTGVLVETLNDTAVCRSQCDALGDQCQAFVLEITASTCKIYSEVTNTIAVNSTVDGVKSLSVKRCFYPADDYFYTEWFNTDSAASTESQLETFDNITAYGLTVCENTLPTGVECRVAGSHNAIPSGVTCDLQGAACEVGVHVTSGNTCPDLEVRYQCARSRVFDGKICSVRDICSEGNTCNNSNCINDPSKAKGYRCGACKPGFTGASCQLTTDECASQPCQNNGTCIDGDQAFSCNCLFGYAGTQCELNPNNCIGNTCDMTGTDMCEDGIGVYTCICRPGYTGANCSENIDECASNPCFHGATCVDQVNSYTCTCPDGWTGNRCESVLNLCTVSSCFNGANCTTLFNGFACSCPTGMFGTQCEVTPSTLLCTNNNPCVNTLDCRLNDSQAVCTCPAGKTGVGCELYIDNNCDNTVCQNGATCRNSASGPVCSCVAGYSGDLCEVNTNECATALCPATSTCIDGTSQAFCRCPVGKAAPDCTADIDENYDMCFFPSLASAGAALPYAVPVSNLQGFTLILYVRFDQTGGTGTFLSLYLTSSSSVTTQRTEVLRLDQAGMSVNLFGSRTLTNRLFPINDRLWHLVVVFWSSTTGQLDLTVDYIRQDRIFPYGQSQTISGNLWLVLGGTEDSTSTSNSFKGCVSGLDMLSRGLDFTTDLPNLQNLPSLYKGDLLRWAEFQEYGNTQFVRPSTARLVNCVANHTEPACAISTRDSTAPEVTYCPEDITVDTIYDDAFASWTEPVFSGGAISVSSSHQSGALFQRGSTTVVYVAEDQAGNSAVCSFSIFVGEATCLAVNPPRGGGMQDCQLQSGSFDACSISCPATNATLVEDVPEYYTCGPSGFWDIPEDQDGLYPTCGRIVGSARADITLHMVYGLSTGQCSTITQGITTQSREELASMYGSWGGDLCGVADCTDVTPSVDCSTLSNTKVDIALTNVSAMLSSANVQRSVEDLWLNAVLDNGIFSFDTIIPAASLNSQLFTVEVTYICEEGQVVRDKLCVECGPGTFYNSSTQQCDNCPLGHYMTGYAALTCTPCPGGQTTSVVGSTTADDCAQSCQRGEFFNGSSCELCQIAFYQNQTGQFECKPCPRGYLTLSEGSTSLASCAEACVSGYELLVNGTCVACSKGTYRQYGQYQLCQPCPAAYTTPDVASISADNCTVLRCPAGSRANTTGTGCELCPVGFYQPLPNQLDCLPCAVNFTTPSPGTQQSSDCQQFCPSGYEVDNGLCMPCPVATYKDNSVDPLSFCLPCPAGYLTANDKSSSMSDCSIRNCSAGFYIQTDNQGVETCALCPLDQFNPVPYQHSCLPCANGTGTRQTGADSDTFCEVFCDSGEELVNGVCTPCPQGYYKNNSDDRFGECSLCPVDFITATTGATSLADCSISNCSAGSYREEFNNTCVSCPLSSYQPDHWQTSCVPCPSERLTETRGAVSKSQCLLSCKPGREDQNGTCTGCPIGFFKNRTGAVSCDACPDGLRTASNGTIDEADCSVAACQPGYYLNSTQNVCIPCPYGQYQPNLWQDSCLPCASGTTTFAEGASSDSQCLKDCAAGSELNMTSDVCIACERGYYRDKSSGDQTACILCPLDFITASSGAALATDCSVANCTTPGRYLNLGNNQCDMCPTGTYNSQWWVEACTPCPSGSTTKITGVANVDSCYRDCPSGQQVDESSNVCVFCVTGTYRDKSQTWTCQPCPTPLTTSGAGATSVLACDVPTCGPGFYYDGSQSQCLPCAVGTYQPQSGMRSCIGCPNSKTTLSTGRTSSSECISLCQTTQNNCSPDAQCSMNNAAAVQCTCNTNYEGDGVTCTHVCDLPTTYCQNGATCSKDRASPCVCATYYSGPRCESRSDPSKSASNTEVIVGTVIGVVVLLLILLLILIGIIVRRRQRQPPSDKDSLSTANSQSRVPSGIIPRINTQNYRNFKPDPNVGKTYDPAYYNASEANRDVGFVAYDNVSYH